MDFNVFHFLKGEVKVWHGRRVAISRRDVPFLPVKVAFMKEFGALRRLWNQTLSLTDVTDDNMTDVGAQLLSRELKLIVLLQLLSSLTG